MFDDDADHARNADHEQEGGTSVAEPVVTTKTAPKTRREAGERPQTRREPPYNVIILNDEEHTFDYVIELLCKLFRHPLATAQELTWKIHTTGRAVVFTTHKELAELKRE